MATHSIELYRRELQGKLCRHVDHGEDFGPLIAAMTRVVHETGTNGIAAPQLGAYVQLAVVRKQVSGVRCQMSGKTLSAASILEPETCNLVPAFEVLINPRVVNLAGKDLLDTECCLSLPPIEEATARIWRSEIAHVRAGTVENPNAEEVHIYRGTAARTVQHEIDHLQGIFFIDRCQPVARGIVLRRFERYLREQEIERREGTTCSVLRGETAVCLQ